MSESLRQAMTEAVKLRTGEAFEIVYYGGSSPGSKRTIMPLKVDRHVVYAKCFNSNEEKNFRFDRMELANGSDAPSWSPFHLHSGKDKAKKPSLISSLKQPTILSKKAIFFCSVFFALIGSFFFGLIGFLVIFSFFVFVGISSNKEARKKTNEEQNNEKNIFFAPVATDGKDTPVKISSSASPHKIHESNSIKTPTTKTEAHNLINNLKTTEDVLSFIKACDAAQDSLYDDHPHHSEKELDRISNVLFDAVDQAEEKTLGWQFVPEINFNTPLEVLNIAFKEFTSSERLALPAKFRTEYGRYWLELAYDTEPDLRDEFLDNAIEFRKIVESDLKDDAMANAIDAYLSEHPIFSVEYFGKLDSEAELSHGQEWMASKLAKEGLPAAWDLYAEGYTTIEKCLEIDPDEFIKRKGIGPKKKQQLIEFQNKHQK